MLLTLLVLGGLMIQIFYCQTVPGGGSCILVMTSFVVVVPVGGFLDVQ